MTGATAGRQALDWRGLESALSLGLSRSPLPPTPGLAIPEEPARVLAVLALIGMRRRLAAPDRPPDKDDPPPVPDDPRPMLPGPAREALLRLDRRLDAEIRRNLAPLILGAVTAAGHRPHIFDLPLIDALLRAAPDRLGPAERAWLEAGATAPRRAPNTEDDEEPASPAERLAALREARRRDPAAARAELARRLPGETAKTRAELVATLAVGLTLEDRDLLESLSADRAKPVRDVAGELLSRLPGSVAHDQRLAAARACLSAGTTGLIRRRPTLKFTPPQKSALQGSAGDHPAILRLFEGFGLSALTRGLLEPAECPEAAAADPVLPPLLARAALWDADVDTAAALLNTIPEPAWPGDLTGLRFDPSLLSQEARRTIVYATLTPAARLSPAHQFPGLAAWLSGSLDADLALRLLALPAWRDRLAELGERCAANDKIDMDTQLLPIAALTPPTAAERLDADLAPIPIARRPRTTAFVMFLRELSRPSPPP